MFIPGQKVVCINDCFHRSIAEWTDHQAMKPNSAPCTDAESRRYFEERYRLEAGSVNAECAARLRAIATATEPLIFDYGHTLQPGQLLAELDLMRAVPVHWPTPGFADAMLACGLLWRVEEICFLHFERRARFTGNWQQRLQRFSANVLAHADAVGL